MFYQANPDPQAIAIGREMKRVLKPGGFIVVNDWATPNPWDSDMRPLSRARVKAIFALPVICVTRGALPPPIGRAISRFLPAVYFMLTWLPFGRRVYVLRNYVAPYRARPEGPR